MLKKILICLLFVVLVVLASIALQPAHFRIERQIKINAPADLVFSYVNGLRSLDQWNPWMKLDPETKITYSGPEVGVGSASSWQGNDRVGEGSAVIMESNPNSLVRIRLEQTKPYQSTNTIEFLVKTEAHQTVVVWSLSGEHGFVSRLLCLVMNMNSMVGETFARGLNDLKSLAESRAH